MRRYSILVVLFLLTLPIQLSVLGCGSNPNNYCNSFGQGFATLKGTLTSIDLEPQQTGISLAYGQVGQLSAPTGKDCTGASVTLGAISYGTNDPTHTKVDISPSGAVCAGRWNQRTNGGVASYTTCLPTNLNDVANVTAGAGGVTSNVVQIFVHPTVTNVTLDTTNIATGQNITGTEGCLSQFQTAQLNATAFVSGNTEPICAPTPNSFNVPDCGSVIGHLTYAAQSTTAAAASGTANSVVTIDPNGVATAKQPGSALITASISGTSSSAGFFYTCPPKSITLTANGGTSVTVTPNTPQPTTATVIDTNNNNITGLPLSYTSTDPRTIGVSSLGAITSTFPGSASVYAVCQPGACNPSPIDRIGVEGNGTPIASNTLNVTSPGSASSFLWMASPLSQFYVALDLSQSTIGTPIHLPYVPNSMVLDQTGSSLYFGSYRELMIYSATANTLTKEDTTVPGVVLAVSPTNGEVLINDQDRQILYLYAPAVAGSTTQGGTGSTGSTGTPASIVTQYGGIGQKAVFSPDASTVYILGTLADPSDATKRINTLFVYNTFTGWSTETLDPTNGTPSTATCPAGNAGLANAAQDLNSTYNVFCSPDVSLAVPQFGAFLSGATTTARGYCPDTRTTPIDNYPSAVAAANTTLSSGAVDQRFQFTSDHLASTTDGNHVISATAAPTAQLIDSSVLVPTDASAAGSGACPSTVAADGTTNTLPLTINNPTNTPQSLAAYQPSLIHQVVTSPNSALAVVTYESATAKAGNAHLPVYTVPASGATSAPPTSVALTGANATTPVAAIFSPDYTEIFVSTAGDNQMHIVSTSTLQDTQQFNSNLPNGSGGTTQAQFLAVKPRAIP